MKRGKSLKNKRNCDIFSQEITPIQNYIIKGDKNPVHEIQALYLQRLSSRWKPIQGIKNISVIPSSLAITIPSSDEKLNSVKRNTLIKIREVGSSDSDINNELIDQNISIDKKSTEFLFSLYRQGIFIEDENKNIELTQRQKQTFKLKDNDPFIYSFNSLHPFSMFYNTKYDKLIKNNKELKLPAPNFIKKEEWCKPVDMTFKTLLKGLVINDNLGVVITDPNLRKRYSGLVRDIIYQLLKVPFGHHISLNVKIFEPRTVLERYSSAFSYSNTFLLPASEPSLKPYERFKLVISFLLAGLHTGCQQLKPFNPFDGETFQGELPNGAKVYVENVTHKPLVARFYIIYKKKYEINGYWDLAVKAQSLGSEMLIYQKGPINVIFPELNECITCHLPCAKAVNATSENNRGLLYSGNSVFVDPKNKLKAVIQYNTNKNKFHELKGCTMEYDYPPGYKYIFDNEWDFANNIIIEQNQISRKKSFKDKIEKHKIIHQIKGSYLEKSFIGDELVFDIDKHIPEHIKPVKHCIPSDGRYREDLIWLYRSFYCAKNEEEEEIYRNISMEWKVMMEEFNRWERKTKANYNEKLKKNKKYK